MIFYFIAAITGVFVKIVDEIEDTLEGRFNIKYIFAVLYGLLIGVTISFSTFPTLWFSIIVAQIITGKIDKISHFIALCVVLIFIIIFGMNNSEFLLPDFLIILFFAAMDETNFFDIMYKDFRLWLKMAMFIFGFFVRWDYFIALMSFDIAYILTQNFFPMHIKKWICRL
ncbi:MAG: hypothetical protein AB1391_02750 [Candidatus Micrarchaeota archaeon]